MTWDEYHVGRLSRADKAAVAFQRIIRHSTQSVQENYEPRQDSVPRLTSNPRHRYCQWGSLAQRHLLGITVGIFNSWL